MFYCSEFDWNNFNFYLTPKKGVSDGKLLEYTCFVSLMLLVTLQTAIVINNSVISLILYTIMVLIMAVPHKKVIFLDIGIDDFIFLVHLTIIVDIISYIYIYYLNIYCNEVMKSDTKDLLNIPRSEEYGVNYMLINFFLLAIFWVISDSTLLMLVTWRVNFG